MTLKRLIVKTGRAVSKTVTLEVEEERTIVGSVGKCGDNVENRKCA